MTVRDELTLLLETFFTITLDVIPFLLAITGIVTDYLTSFIDVRDLIE